MKRNKEIKTKWRRVFRAKEGETWTRVDISQQEPRTTVHYAELCELSGSRQAAQRYRDDPNTDSYQILIDLCGLKREDVKEIFLGRSYGMGTGKMARKLGLPTVKRESKFDGLMRDFAGPEAQQIIDQFDGAVPFVRALAKRCESVAKGRGFLRTMSGRRCRFPRDGHGNFDWTYKALNRLIQGSAADQTKAALVALDKAGFESILTVHDEFDFSMADPTQIRGVVEIVKHAIPLNVPVRVDAEIGANYGELEKFE
jgi:DNA polymerase I-like protein with 3'-5' exonuclease and polymerase domains